MDPSKLKQLEAYQKGDELGGYKIYTIVGRNDDFMVCTIELQRGLGVHWRTRETHTLSEPQRGHLAAFNERYDLVKKVFPEDTGQVEALASALYQGLCPPAQEPGNIFKVIDTRISAAREEASSRTRAVYGVSAAVTAIVLFPILFLIASLDVSAGRLLGEVPLAALLVCAAFGTLGALASVLQNFVMWKYPITLDFLLQRSGAVRGFSRFDFRHCGLSRCKSWPVAADSSGSPWRRPTYRIWSRRERATRAGTS